MLAADRWDDDANDMDDPQPEDMDADDSGESDLLVCPACRGAVHPDTEKCPHCGDWITPEFPAQAGKRWTWALAAGLVIAAMLLSSIL